MGIIEDKANLVAADMSGPDTGHPKFAIMTILTIIGIIVNIIKIYQQCKAKPAAAAISMRSGGIVERWRLRKVINDHLGTDGDTHEVRQQLMTSTLKVSATLQDDEVQQMYDEAVNVPTN